MFRIDVQALSVNQAWKGKKYKSKDYRNYEVIVHALLARLPLPKIRDGDPFWLFVEFGIPALQDCSNGLKTFEDILCDKLKINDRYCFGIYLRKVVTKKKDCYIRFDIHNNEHDFLQQITGEV